MLPINQRAMPTDYKGHARTRDSQPSLRRQGDCVTHPEHLWTMILDDAGPKVARRLSAAGLPFIVLKGVSIATWLYEEPLRRTYRDIDLLVDPRREKEVVAALGDIGYQPLLDAASIRFLTPEEQPLENERGVMVDLHITLKGLNVTPERAWELLSNTTTTLHWAGTPVATLSEPARAMHLVLHLAQRGLADTKAARDLQLGLELLGDQIWQRAAAMAHELCAIEAFAGGLSLLPEGVALIRRLGLPEPTHLGTHLSTGSAAHRTQQLQRALSARRLRDKWGLIRVLLFPSKQWLRLFEAEATKTRWGLLRTRTLRPWRILVRAPSAVLERRVYRKRVRSGEPQ